ncbi:hypothetical protein K0I73_14510 [Shewanella mesophila]|uniref:hypothetical protein n=1 Tax=Shewanella mesophila TaxID=2864208 RepID=UPI001C6577D2|nr:hypothetical protein [Shewanella mesophila]QYJ85403.1 hypothetical protein K0I73_14510 [Shewanella mesophila]
MMRFLMIGLLLIANAANATSIDEHTEDKAQIRTLLHHLYVDGKDANSSAEAYLYNYFLPTDLKRLHVVSGADGERKKWNEMLQAFDVKNERFHQYLEMLSNAEHASIKFFTGRTGESQAIIEVEAPRQPRFTKYQGKWYASM